MFRAKNYVLLLKKITISKEAKALASNSEFVWIKSYLLNNCFERDLPRKLAIALDEI